MVCKWSDLEFTVYDMNATWYSVAGLYIFAHRTVPTKWRALYIGETDNFCQGPRYIPTPGAAANPHFSRSEVVRYCRVFGLSFFL
jgi:hypothetical protein